MVGVCGLLAVVTAPATFGQADDETKDEKPEITVRATPQMGVAPFSALLTAEVRGGPDDYQQFYCATAEWDMGDGNESEQTVDCEPYEAGKSQIQRRYTQRQTFDTAGEYRVLFRLKQKDKVVAAGSTTVRVRPGIGDLGGGFR
jgi:hypothetical protein